MGLDMYLFVEKSTYTSHYDLKAHPEKQELVKDFFPKELKTFQDQIFERNFLDKTERFQIGYWRKANAIHNWIVQNCADGVDECQDIFLSEEKISTLRDLCIKVLDNPQDSANLLPTASGFFFGSQAYDEWYMDEIKYTKDLLDQVLAFLSDRENEETPGIYYSILYRASW